MSHSSLHYLEASEIACLIRTRELSSVEVVTAMLERIAQLDGTLNSYALVTADDALAEAREADRKLAAGEPTGPLHGVPVGIKDLFWVAGHPTTAGTTIHRNFVPTEDASVVTRLREAGAVILGKLRMTEGAFAIHHPDLPSPQNPWNANHWAGASSSGSGVATAAGLCYASLGSDTGGSIRFPSAANGLTGIKPTWGRVSRHGAFELGASLDHVGPMARSATDAALLLGVIAGYDPRDPTTLPELRIELPDQATDLRGLRIGIDMRWNSEGTDEVIVRALEQVVRIVKDLGGEIREVKMPPVRTVVDEWLIDCGVQVALAHEATFPRLSSEYGPALTHLIGIGRETDAFTYERALRNRAALRGQVNHMMSDIDLLIAPVQPFAAPTHAQLDALAQDPELNARLIQYTAPFNSTGHPSMALPCGSTGNRLPIGFQLIARHGAEAVLCRAGMAFQHATDWHRAHPLP
ncbi:amidase [Paraburkholderia adhaesiva]|uniref:amidase n=1 Tax=Paraburkholderia adhaesiva TaxID=2883244 RepID=UPI001F27A9F8|nr:amidase [Paraburkholderia adhaesiva]